MTARNWSRRGKAPTLSRADRDSEAKAALAAFLAKGGAVKQMPGAVPTEFVCTNCGHAGIMGVTPGKKRRCPKCRELLSFGE
jgi:hypothetical protein